MAALSKYIWLLTLLVLTVLGSVERFEGRAEKKIKDTKKQEIRSYATYSAKGLDKYVNLQAEKTFNFIHSLPVPNVKKAESTLVNWYHFELNLQVLVSKYIRISGFICRNLTNYDLIFPFHYFW
jgi:hypothetical protein